jgi:septal ring factor EnvC (AmiA/AmiB activator)
MKKENAFKIILIVGLILTCVVIYNDKQKIERLDHQLVESQRTVTDIGKEKQDLEIQLNACKDKEVIRPANGVYTPEQMDEIDRRIKEQEK